jgi:hypothetical protein
MTGLLAAKVRCRTKILVKPQSRWPPVGDSKCRFEVFHEEVTPMLISRRVFLIGLCLGLTSSAYAESTDRLKVLLIDGRTITPGNRRLRS